MFRQQKYLKEDPKYIFDFIENHPFATLVIKEDELLATHIPVLIKGNSENFILFGHIAQANEQYKHLKDGLEALLIFQGAHGYISSSWYKEVDISTWDYSAVHINVRLRLQSRDELLDCLRSLVTRFEKFEKHPLEFNRIPEKMIEDHLPLITGFWCEPTKVQAIAKLHQGFEKQDITTITKRLEQRQDPISSELSKDIKKQHDTNH